MPPEARGQSGERQLTARSILASTLLGTEPARLPVSFLVRTAALFGLSEGAVRTALSRMVSSGEARTDGDGFYELVGELSARQARQQRSRVASTVEWNGRWRVAVVQTGSREATERAELRSSMTRLRMVELREGVWLRPDNLNREGLEREMEIADQQCIWFDAVPVTTLEEPEDELVARLWNLSSWAERATELRRRMHSSIDDLAAGEGRALADGFVLSASVLRHFGADPLLPREVLPRSWPGQALRRDYDDYDELYRQKLAIWTTPEGATNIGRPQLRS